MSRKPTVSNQPVTKITTDLVEIKNTYGHKDIFMSQNESLAAAAAKASDLRLGRAMCRQIARDRTAAASARVAAARTLLELAGQLGPAVRRTPADKEPQEMSTAELHATVARLEAALADRAKLVSPAPIDAELADMLS